MHLAVALLVCLFAPSMLSISIFDSSLQRKYNSKHNEWPPDVVVV
uniref:Chemokine (C-C motif) ligand 14 n=1 Tax=Ascaris lumbricoides TaxID=6252 RepID=A0A0M3IKF1_ASCLU